MTYDFELADRLREILAAEPEVTEKRLFGGLAFLVAGHLAVSANSRGSLMVRADPAQVEVLLQDPRVSRFVMRGREMKGWLGIETGASVTDEELARWVEHGVSYARSLPPKSGSVSP